MRYKATVVLLVSALLISCTAPDRTRETLKKAGFTEIKVKGWRALNCSTSDMFSTGFEAKNPNGVTIEGVVCCGLVAKRCTIRF